MIVLTSPEDDFNGLEVIEFHYKARVGQVTKSSLKVSIVKFEATTGGSYAYSDEPPIEIFIKDVPSHIAAQIAASNTVPYSSFGAVQGLVVDLLGTEKGLAAEITA